MKGAGWGQVSAGLDAGKFRHERGIDPSITSLSALWASVSAVGSPKMKTVVQPFARFTVIEPPPMRMSSVVRWGRSLRLRHPWAGELIAPDGLLGDFPNGVRAFRLLWPEADVR
jgi:hypothetical protein